MANDVTVRRSFKPGEILVEVVSVGLYGLTAAEIPIAPIAGLEASTVQGALERLIASNADEVGIWNGKLVGSTGGYVNFVGDYARHGSFFMISGSINLVNTVETITGQLMIENTPVVTKIITRGAMTASNLPSASRLMSATTAVGWNPKQARVFPVINSSASAGVYSTDIDNDTIIVFSILAIT